MLVPKGIPQLRAKNQAHYNNIKSTILSAGKIRYCEIREIVGKEANCHYKLVQNILRVLVNKDGFINQKYKGGSYITLSDYQFPTSLKSLNKENYNKYTREYKFERSTNKLSDTICDFTGHRLGSTQCWNCEYNCSTLIKFSTQHLILCNKLVEHFDSPKVIPTIDSPKEEQPKTEPNMEISLDLNKYNKLTQEYKYEIDKFICIDKCPFKIDTMIGSLSCEKCSCRISNDNFDTENLVKCTKIIEYFSPTIDSSKEEQPKTNEEQEIKVGDNIIVAWTEFSAGTFMNCIVKSITTNTIVDETGEQSTKSYEVKLANPKSQGEALKTYNIKTANNDKMVFKSRHDFLNWCINQ